ncbi:LANO_0E08812g1_1 [Lachancea nothofagi CBS 11611]|uniref:LANO_0E08812g1_1 n=1 Tax=Lachancea nothofagi CBS 11611 TaxID=1266666 RepID=A0A1G4JVJ1_9SACH|nr:LANO_0E08812g1_1 [Lachancea nothofagi CBS 11611]
MTNSTSESNLSTATIHEKKRSVDLDPEVPSLPPIRTLPRQTEQTEARPQVDYQDKLWTQIDVLDDVRRMAREQDAYDGFPPGFESQLKELREAHITLLHTMNKRRDEQEEGKNTEDGNELERRLVDEVTECLQGLRK